MTIAAPTLFVHPSDVSVQTMVRLPLPIVEGNKDYREHEALLRRMDDLLECSGVEAAFLAAQVGRARCELDKAGKPLTDRMRSAVQRHGRQAGAALYGCAYSGQREPSRVFLPPGGIAVAAVVLRYRF